MNASTDPESTDSALDRMLDHYAVEPSPSHLPPAILARARRLDQAPVPTTTAPASGDALSLLWRWIGGWPFAVPLLAASLLLGASLPHALTLQPGASVTAPLSIWELALLDADRLDDLEVTP